MSYLVDLKADIDAHVALWAPIAQLVEDNERSKTKELKEFVRMVVLPGDGFIATRTGVRHVTGTRIRYPVLIRFNIFTELHSGIDRCSEIADDILSHWQLKMSGRTHTLVGSYERGGEAPPRYKAAVDIEAFHDHINVV